MRKPLYSLSATAFIVFSLLCALGGWYIRATLHEMERNLPISALSEHKTLSSLSNTLSDLVLTLNTTKSAPSESNIEELVLAADRMNVEYLLYKGHLGEGHDRSHIVILSELGIELQRLDGLLSSTSLFNRLRAAMLANRLGHISSTLSTLTQYANAQALETLWVQHAMLRQLHTGIMIVLGLIGMSILGILALLVVRRKAQRQIEKANAAIFASEQNLSNIFEMAPVPLTAYRAFDNSVIMANQATTDFHEVTEDELLGTRLPDLFGDEAGLQWMTESLAQDQATRNKELQFNVFGTKSKKWVLVSARQSSLSGEDAYIVGYLDIDLKRHAAELMSEAKQKAEEASQAKSDFMANMSHEIRTPMNAIISMCYFATQTDLTGKQRKYLEKINDSTNELMEIIDGILDFSTMDSGDISLENGEFFLDDILENFPARLQSMALDKGLKFHTHIDSGVPTGLIGDAKRVRKIVSNLADNAIKFTEKGEVFVHVENLEKTESSARLKISVRDTGIGITAENQEKIFQAFTQGDSSSGRKHGGLGLGLILAKRLVESMGGEIGVESASEEGATFWFVIEFGLHQNVRPAATEKTTTDPVPKPGATAEDSLSSAPEPGMANLSPVDPAVLLSVLEELEPHLFSRKPRQAKEISRKLNKLVWSPDTIDIIQSLQTLISKYKFKEAQSLLETAREIVRKME